MPLLVERASDTAFVGLPQRVTDSELVGTVWSAVTPNTTGSLIAAIGNTTRAPPTGLDFVATTTSSFSSVSSSIVIDETLVVAWVLATQLFHDARTVPVVLQFRGTDGTSDPVLLDPIQLQLAVFDSAGIRIAHAATTCVLDGSAAAEGGTCQVLLDLAVDISIFATYSEDETVAVRYMLGLESPLISLADGVFVGDLVLVSLIDQRVPTPFPSQGLTIELPSRDLMARRQGASDDEFRINIQAHFAAAVTAFEVVLTMSSGLIVTGGESQPNTVDTSAWTGSTAANDQVVSHAYTLRATVNRTQFASPATPQLLFSTLISATATMSGPQTIELSVIQLILDGGVDQTATSRFVYARDTPPATTGSAVVHVAVPVTRALFSYTTVHQLTNFAVLNPDPSASAALGFQRTSTIMTVAYNSLGERTVYVGPRTCIVPPTAALILGISETAGACTVHLDASMTGPGGLVQASVWVGDSVMETPFRIWTPGNVSIAVAQASLQLISGWSAPAPSSSMCVPQYQSSSIRVSAAFTSGTDVTPALDVTDYAFTALTLGAGCSGVLRLDSRIKHVVGEGNGTCAISHPATSTPAIVEVDDETPVAILHRFVDLRAIVALSSTVNVVNNAVPVGGATEYGYTVTVAEPVLSTEGQQALVVAIVHLSDGTSHEVTVDGGLALVSTDTATIAVSTTPTIIVPANARNANGPLVVGSLTDCATGAVIATGDVDLAVALELATAARLACSDCQQFTNTAYLFVSGGCADKIPGFASESRLAIDLFFPSRGWQTLSLDSRTNLTFTPSSGTPSTLVSLIFSTEAGWLIRTHGIAGGIGAGTLTVTFAGQPIDVMATLELVVDDCQELTATPIVEPPCVSDGVVRVADVLKSVLGTSPLTQVLPLSVL